MAILHEIQSIVGDIYTFVQIDITELVVSPEMHERINDEVADSPFIHLLTNEASAQAQASLKVKVTRLVNPATGSFMKVTENGDKAHGDEVLFKFEAFEYPRTLSSL